MQPLGLAACSASWVHQTSTSALNAQQLGLTSGWTCGCGRTPLPASQASRQLGTRWWSPAYSSTQSQYRCVDTRTATTQYMPHCQSEGGVRPTYHHVCSRCSWQCETSFVQASPATTRALGPGCDHWVKLRPANHSCPCRERCTNRVCPTAACHTVLPCPVSTRCSHRLVTVQDLSCICLLDV
jgi:hypothetical protein